MRLVSQVTPKSRCHVRSGPARLCLEVTKVFAKGMIVDFLLILFLMASVTYVISRTKSRKSTWQIRRIPGLDAIAEGIGRAVEMNRPLFYLPGSGGFSEPQLLASMVILSEVAKMAARYDARLVVCVPSSSVYPVMQEVVRQSYVSQGKGDRFRVDDVRWFSDHYFGYAIAIIALMFKEKVATNIMIGNFAFDALMYAEAASQAGAIQVAGTTSTTQIPFFVAACDYALIGEELYAAAAYLTKDPVRVATLVAEDWGKILTTGLVLLGALLKTAGSVDGLKNLLSK